MYLINYFWYNFYMYTFGRPFYVDALYSAFNGIVKVNGDHFSVNHAFNTVSVLDADATRHDKGQQKALEPIIIYIGLYW